MSDIHTQIEDWMAAALMDGLSGTERRQFDHHLSGCAACSQLFKEEQMLSTTVEQALAEDRPGKRFEDRMVTGFRKRLTRRESAIESWVRRFRQMRFSRWGAVLATLVLLFAFGGLLTSVSGHRRDWALQNQPDQRLKLPEENAGLLADMEPVVSGRKSELNGLDASKGFQFPLQESRKTEGFAGLAGDEVPEEGTKQKDSDGETMAASSPEALSSGGVGGATLAVSESPAQEISTGTPDARKLIRNASLELEILNFGAAVEKLIRIARDENGFVATSRSERRPNGRMRGEVVLKVDYQHLDSALMKLRAVGDVKSQELTTEDVTKSYADTDARLRNSQRLEARLLDMLDKAKGKVSELLEVEKELSRVRGEIEQMQGQLKMYDHLVQFATVTVRLTEKDLEEPATFLLKEQVRLAVASSDVETSFQEAKNVAEDLKAQILHANLSRSNADQISATLQVLVGPELSDELVQRFKKMGRIQSLVSENQRVAQDGTGTSEKARVEKDKVQIDLTLIDDGAPVQSTEISILTRKVEGQVSLVKKMVDDAGAEVRHSTFQHMPNGQETADLTIRLPMNRGMVLMEDLKKLGIVKSFSVQRQERDGPAGEDEPSEIHLQLYSEADIVSSETGILPTFKRTCSQGMEVLMWSIRTLGVAVAFLLPWLTVGLFAWGGVRFFRRRKKL